MCIYLPVGVHSATPTATEAEERDRFDSTIRGYKTRLKTDPEGAKADARRVILNTYRTLM